MTAFALWIVVKDPFIQTEISNKLLNLGLTLTALSADGKVIYNDHLVDLAAFTLAYRVDFDPALEKDQDKDKEKPAMTNQDKVVVLRDKVMAGLKDEGIKYLALIVSGLSGGCGWVGSNIKHTNDAITISIDNKDTGNKPKSN